MFLRVNQVLVALALVYFSYLQYQGYDLFESQSRSGGHGSSSRTYHK